MAAKTKTDAQVITALNDVLTAELTAINQYFIHAKMCADWGYDRLHQTIRAESIDEMKHAEQIIERLLYLGGVPNLQRMGKVNVGETVLEQFTIDLALENQAIPRLIDGIDLCTEKRDHGTRLLFERILEGEEEHVDWLEAQLELIDQMGIENYLAQQIKDA
jgi:bacterioferritin